MKLDWLLAFVVCGAMCGACHDDSVSDPAQPPITEEKPGNNSGGGEEKPEDDSGTNLIKNAGFEQTFSAERTPRIIGLSSTNGNNTLNFINSWYASDRATNAMLEVDSNTGANGSSSSLKFSASNVSASDAVDLSYPIRNVASGRYTLSFYGKSNQEKGASFVTSIILCEDDADVAKEVNKQKAIVLQDGKQFLKTGQKKVWATMISSLGKDWKNYRVTVDIPSNVLVKVVIKPCAGANGDKEDYSSDITSDITCWFDDFLFDVEKYDIAVDYTKPYLTSFSASSVEYSQGLSTVNGRPFIPLGIFGVRKEYISLVASYGFNLVQDYGFITWDAATQRAYLDEAKGNWVMVFATLSATTNTPDQVNRIKQCVANFKNHPALYAWFLADEPDDSKISPADLKAIYDWIKQNDTKHPIISSNWRLQQYKDACDADMRQIYFGVASKCAPRLKEYVNGTASLNKDWVVILNSHDTNAESDHEVVDPSRLFSELLKADKGEDSQEWKVLKERVLLLSKNLEHPEVAGFKTGPYFPTTLAAIKGSFYWALVHGSNGFYYWLFQHPQEMSWRYGHYTLFQQTPLRQYIIRSLEEIGQLSKFLLNPSVDTISFYDKGNIGMFVWSREVDGQRIIIVVNETGNEQKGVKIKLSGISPNIKSVQVFGEDERGITLENEELTDSFEKDGSHVYFVK